MIRIKNELLSSLISISSLTVFLFYGCGGDRAEIQEIPQDEVVVTEKTTLFNVDNKVFYIPNPIQTSLLMKKLAVPYNKDIINAANNSESYATAFKQAVNIGVYGADLGYITANDQNQDALSHLGAVKTLADNLDITAAFNFGELEKFGKNVGNQQEMLTIITSAYKSCEAFLREEDRHDMAGLIMAGALIESLFFAVNFTSSDGNQDVVNRIGDQIKTLDNIILILNPHYSTTSAPALSTFVDQLVDLQNDFRSVKVKYTYEKSTVDTANKLCTVNSKSSISMTPKLLDIVANKVKTIRDSITS